MIINSNFYLLQEAYKRVLNEDDGGGGSVSVGDAGNGGAAANAPEGAMSSGPILQASLDDPKHAIYGVWRAYDPKTSKKKRFSSKRRLVEFLEKNPKWKLISEGGKAVAGVKPIPQKVIKDTIAKLEKDILSKIGLTKRGVDWELLGSAGKKSSDSGDLDIAVNTLSLIRNNKGLSSFGDLIAFLKEFLDKHEYTYNHMPGINVLSISFEQAGIDDAYVQVDLMPTDDIEFSKWAYWSPEENETKFKKMGLYRNNLLQSIAHESFTEILKQLDDGTPTEVKHVLYSFDKGLYTRVSSYIGKNNKILKNPVVLSREKEIKDVPEIIKLLLGPNATVKDTNSFETIWKIMKSPKFIHKDKLPQIVKYAIKDLERKEMPIPEELSNEIV